MKRRVLMGGMLAGLLVTGEGRQAVAAEVTLKPYLTVGEEVTDNVHETAHDRRTEYITRVQPGFSLRYLAPRLDWDSAYSFEYRFYARDSEGDEYTHNADMRSTVTLVENFMFLDLHDSYHRVSLDVTRDPATESSLFLNQTDENRATISPYFLWRLGEKTTLKTGYRYTDVRYWGEGVERSEHGAFADLSHEVTDKLTLTGGYAFTRLLSDTDSYYKHDAYGGFRYNYAEKSFLYGQAGNSWQSFDHGRSTSYLFWNAGLTHDFSVLVLTLETRVQNSSDPSAGSSSGSYSSIDPLNVSTKQTSYSARIDKAFERGSLGLFTSYTEYKETDKSSDSSDSSYHKYAVGGSGRYELIPDLSVGLSVTGERTSGKEDEDYPYRLSGSFNVAYAFNNDLSLSLTYSHTTNRHHLDSSKDAEDVNRGIVELKKNF